jgi:hypothetical protein
MKISDLLSQPARQPYRSDTFLMALVVSLIPSLSFDITTKQAIRLGMRWLGKSWDVDLVDARSFVLYNATEYIARFLAEAGLQNSLPTYLPPSPR